MQQVEAQALLKRVVAVDLDIGVLPVARERFMLLHAQGRKAGAARLRERLRRASAKLVLRQIERGDERAVLGQAHARAARQRHVEARAGAIVVATRHLRRQVRRIDLQRMLHRARDAQAAAAGAMRHRDALAAAFEREPFERLRGMRGADARIVARGDGPAARVQRRLDHDLRRVV